MLFTGWIALMRAALYARVSTDEQAKEGFSLDAQIKKLEAYCRFKGYEVAGYYREEGFSGRNTNRPEYQRMFSDIAHWDVLLVLKMDRIHRNSVNFAGMMDVLNKNGKQFESVQENYDTSNAMGRFVMDMMQRIAQLESERTGERVKDGMTYKARNETGTLGSGHPYGYEFDNGRLRVINDEALTVRAIYRMYIRGSSMDDIAKSLNDASIPAKKGGKWNRQSVCNILHNPLYVGYNRWDGMVRKGDQEPIIEMSIYETVNGPLSV